MDFIETKNLKLSQLINSCSKTEQQLNKMRKSFQISDSLEQLNLQKPPQKSRSIELIRSSRIHMDEFQKSQSKLSNSHSMIKVLQQSVFKPIKKYQSAHCSINQRKKLLKRKITQHQQNQVQQNHRQSQEISTQSPKQIKNTQQAVNLQFIPHKLSQLSTYYLPRIATTYQQTFSPKNASLSQESIIKKQLQHSVYRKSFDEKCKKYNKQNMVKEYEEKKNKQEQKLQLYRLNVLKKISFDNVKKYLYEQKKRKEAHALALVQQRKLYKSHIQTH